MVDRIDSKFDIIKRCALTLDGKEKFDPSIDTGSGGISFGLYKYVSLIQKEHLASPRIAEVANNFKVYDGKL